MKSYVAKPSLRVVKTVGGFFRVIVHGPDALQDGERYFETDIGTAETKEDALQQARDWFASLQDCTPKSE